MQQSKRAAANPQTKDFLWGAATASHQVEGNQHNNWSVWEASVANKLAESAEKRFKATSLDWKAFKTQASDPNNYISGAAADHYNRYREDFDLMQQLGLNAYRFAIEWSRIEPEPGVYDQKALDHYADMVKELKNRDIEPLVTLHHFSDPIWLEDHGGWHGSEVVERFASYAEVVSQNLGPLNYYCTINEPGSYLLMRYLAGDAWPEWPKLNFNPAQGYKYLKNVIKAHKLASGKIKAVNPTAQVGLAHALIDFQLDRHDPLSWLFKKQLEYIPDMYLMNRLKKDIDYIGVNYYLRMIVKVGFSHPSKWAYRWKNIDGVRSDVGWELYPKGLYTVTQKVKKFGLPLFITENGIADANDKLRGQYIQDHISEMMRSKKDGANIKGYLYWSLLDNYEWSEGYWPKFGLIAVDHKTQKRTLRASAKEYAKIIKST